jgi:hypothetical protein
VLFIIIGLGSLVVAIVPGAHEWVAEQTLDATTPPAFEDDEFFQDTRDETVQAIVDSDGVVLTAWILAATFLPMAALFIWIGRWFGSMARDGFGDGIPYDPQGVPMATGVPGYPPGTTAPPSNVPGYPQGTTPPPEGFIR